MNDHVHPAFKPLIDSVNGVDIVEAMRRDTVHNFLCGGCGEPVSRRIWPAYEAVGLGPCCARVDKCQMCTYMGPLTRDGLCPDCAGDRQAEASVEHEERI